MTRYRDRYEPIALAGRGAQGEVWMAHDHLHGRSVALKIADVRGRDRDAVLAEARTLLDLRPHDALPLVRDDFFSDDDRYVLVMDWIDGRNLGSSRPASFEAALDQLDAVARALDHLHSHDPPVLHRDVKPHNIVVTSAGRTVLVDLGLADRSRQPYLQGTPSYTAPEVFASGSIGPSADVFGLAATAFELLTGVTPSPGCDPDWSLVPAGARERTRDVLAAAMSTDPRTRPRTAGQLVAALHPPAAPNNLPAELSTFVGRTAELAELGHRLTGARLLTLTGPGGCGKTRLALRTVDSALSRFEGGVWLAELAHVADGDAVLGSMCSALGVRSEGSDELEALSEYLSGAPTLVLLDNCEHVIDVCAHLSEALLRACPDLTIMATSREPLRAVGEVVHACPPLDEDESVKLFRQRAPADAELDQRTVARICERLEGIPLAVELAAARLLEAGLADLDASLASALDVLVSGPRTNPRQETMRATIDWSYRLLGGADQGALRRLSMFIGGCSADAAAVVSCPPDALLRLVDASLVRSADGRHRMLETVRQFADEELRSDPDRDDVRDAFLGWAVDLTESEGSHGTGTWVEVMAAEDANIEHALAIAEDAAPALAARIAFASADYWKHVGKWSSGRRWLERVIAAPASDDALHVKLLIEAGDIARRQGDPRHAQGLHEQALGLARRLDDGYLLAMSTNSLATAHAALGETTIARALYVESTEIGRRIGLREHVAAVNNNLGVMLLDLGEPQAAIAALEESRSIMQDLDPLQAATITFNLAAITHRFGDVERARVYMDEADEAFERSHDKRGQLLVLRFRGRAEVGAGDLDAARDAVVRGMTLAESLGDREGIADLHYVLGEIVHRSGDTEMARHEVLKALEIRRDMGSLPTIAPTLEGLSVLEAELGMHVDAVRSFAESRGMRVAAGDPRGADDAAVAALEGARRTLGDAAYRDAYLEGLRAAGVSEGDMERHLPSS